MACSLCILGSWWLIGVGNRKSVMRVIGLLDGMVWFYMELVGCGMC